MWEFSTMTHEWKEVKIQGSVPNARCCHSVAVSSNIMFMYGGKNQFETLSDLHVFDLKALNWL